MFGNMFSDGVVSLRLRLDFSGRQLGRTELLTVVGDLRNTQCSESLPMSLQLLVLLLALEMKNQDLFRTAFVDDLGGNSCAAAVGLHNLSRFSGDGEHVGCAELHFALGPMLDRLGKPNNVPGRNLELLAAGANDRVHKTSI